MEKSRAIDLLDNLIGMIEDNQDNDYDTAFRMAIEALKAQLFKEGTTSDLISRRSAIDAINSWRGRFSEEYNEAIDDCENSIKALPTIQPEPKEGEWIPHDGYWIKYDDRFPWRHVYKCSECGNYLDFSGINGGRGEANYCPSCGAKMKGEQDGH